MSSFPLNLLSVSDAASSDSATAAVSNRSLKTNDITADQTLFATQGLIDSENSFEAILRQLDTDQIAESTPNAAGSDAAIGRILDSGETKNAVGAFLDSGDALRQDTSTLPNAEPASSEDSDVNLESASVAALVLQQSSAIGEPEVAETPVEIASSTPKTSVRDFNPTGRTENDFVIQQTAESAANAFTSEHIDSGRPGSNHIEPAETNGYSQLGSATTGTNSESTTPVTVAEPTEATDQTNVGDFDQVELADEFTADTSAKTEELQTQQTAEIDAPLEEVVSLDTTELSTAEFDGTETSTSPDIPDVVSDAAIDSDAESELDADSEAAEATDPRSNATATDSQDSQPDLSADTTPQDSGQPTSNQTRDSAQTRDFDSVAVDIATVNSQTIQSTPTTSETEAFAVPIAFETNAVSGPGTGIDADSNPIGQLTASAATSQAATAIQNRFSSLDDQPKQSISLELNPPELGQLQITVEQTTDQMVASIVATEFQATEMLLQEKDFLLQALSDLGFGDTSLDISHGDGSANHESERDSQSSLPSAYGGNEAVTEAAVSVSSQTSGVNVVA